MKEKQIINKIKNKLITNKAIITKADKGNSIVITYQEDYHNKILMFINDNSFASINNDPTKAFQKELRIVTNECQNLIKKEKMEIRELETFSPLDQWPAENT